MTRLAATKCFEAAGLRPSDVDVVELHDCFSANELITYEALGLCAEGKKAAGFTTLVSTCSRTPALREESPSAAAKESFSRQSPPYLSALIISSSV